MKKMISLVVLASVLMLMSFSLKSEKQTTQYSPPTEQEQDDCHNEAMGAVKNLKKAFTLSMDAEYGYYGSFYDSCIGRL